MFKNKENPDYVYLPVLNAECIEVMEIHIENELDISKLLKTTLKCEKLDTMQLEEDIFFVYDKEGNFKNHKLAYSFASIPNKALSKHIWSGYCSLVKKVGEDMFCFRDSDELVKIIRNYLSNQIVYKVNPYNFNLN